MPRGALVPLVCVRGQLQQEQQRLDDHDVSLRRQGLCRGQQWMAGVLAAGHRPEPWPSLILVDPSARCRLSDSHLWQLDEANGRASDNSKISPWVSIFITHKTTQPLQKSCVTALGPHRLLLAPGPPPPGVHHTCCRTARCPAGIRGRMCSGWLARPSFGRPLG